MTEVLELVNIDIPDIALDKCPFCAKAPHDFATKKNEPTEVKSKPNQLKCADVPGGRPGSHTTAKHHLICAIQCFAKTKRLARMATMAGYDVNDPPNGLGLPTVRNMYQVPDGAKPRKYADLDEEEKQLVANRVMKATGAQWHVGHHAFEIRIPGDWDPDEGGEKKEVAHVVSYDTTVIQRLLAIQNTIESAKICQDTEDKSAQIKNMLDKLSGKIKAKLMEFAGSSPKSSSPFFVSMRAFKYAEMVEDGTA